jgi:hypothetical protein
MSYRNIIFIAMESEKKIGIPFPEFINKATNLITVFGIFNALFIFSTSFEKTQAYQFLGIAFFVLSVYVWIEIISMAMKFSDTTWRYELFIMFAVSITIGLVVLFYELFKLQILVVAAAGLYFIILFIIGTLVMKVSMKKLAKMKGNKRQIITLLLIIASITITFIILKILSPSLKPLFEKWMEIASVKIITK